MKKKNERNPKSRSQAGLMKLKIPLEILRIKEVKQITNIQKGQI